MQSAIRDHLYAADFCDTMPRMGRASHSKVRQTEVPPGSLLAAFGGPEDYRDCFIRDVAGEVTLAQFIERFYSSTAFLPERLFLKALSTPAGIADIRALASGETDRFGAWKVVERRDHNAGEEVAEHGPARSASPEAKSETQLAKGHLQGRPQARKGRGNRSAEALRKTRLEEILLESKDTGTASWFRVEPREGGTPLSSSSGAVGQQTRLYFGSWVGGIDQSGWRAMLAAHVSYSRVLLGGV